MMQTSTGKPTKYEQERMEAMLKLGCAAFAQLGIWHIAEVHHICEGNRRLGHWYTLPLSAAAHRGIWTPELIEAIPPEFRVSIADGSRAFEKVYGSQRALWEKVQTKLKLPMVWPVSKIVPRRLHDIAATDGRLVGVSTGAADLPQAQSCGSGSAVPSDACDAPEGRGDAGQVS